MTGNTITAREIADKLGVTKRTINRRSEDEDWPHENGGNRAKHFFISSLPEDLRLAILIARAKASNIPAITRNLPTPVGSPELTNQQNRIGLAWADLLRAYATEKERAKAVAGESVVDTAKLFMAGYNTGQLLPGVFKILGEASWKTTEAKLNQFRQANHNYMVLAPKWGNRKGQHKVTDEEFNRLLAFALHPNRLRVAEISRLTKLVLKKRGIPSPSHEATLRRALIDWKDTHYDQWVFCREGGKALNDKCLPYIERDAGLLDVGDVLVADGHPLNFKCLNPNTGKPCRATMLMWYDWASCYPVGWEIMPTENVQAIAAGLRRAILTIGKMPKVVYLDNGRAFKAKVFTSKDIDFEEAGFYGMFARLGIETTFAWPYNAQSKTVERFFGTFNELERLMPTYTGASIQDKPAHMRRNEKLHRKMHEKKYGGWVPTIKETNQIIAAWVQEYAQRPHRGIKGLCPGEVLKAGCGPGIDEKALRHLMMSMEVKQVNRNGIRLFGRNYYDPALYGYQKRVMIRYDIEDLSKIYIYDETGSTLICEADVVMPVHPMAKLTGKKEDMDFVKTGIKQKLALKKNTEREARAYIEDAPTLVAIPEKTIIEHRTSNTEHRITTKPQPLPRAEAERINAAAAKMKVVELHPKTENPIYMNDPDRYEALMERECAGETLSLDNMVFMRYFEQTDLYKEFKERFDFLQEIWLSKEEELPQ